MAAERAFAVLASQSDVVVVVVVVVVAVWWRETIVYCSGKVWSIVVIEPRT